MGKNFLSVPEVRLTRSGTTPITAAQVVVKSNFLLSCAFDLATALEGVYDVLIDRAGSTYVMPRAYRVLRPNALYDHWNITGMGAVDTPLVSGHEGGLIVADGDNNTLPEVYACNRNPRFFRFAWSGSAWSQQSQPPAPGTENLYDLLSFDGDGDGAKEIYAAADNGQVVAYRAPNWTRSLVGTTGGKVLALAYGDGDNDGLLELYAASADDHVYEFKYNGASWATVSIGAGTADFIALAVGDGNNDDQFEVYAADASHQITEFKKNGTAWNASLSITGPASAYALTVADGNGDGQNEIYAANEDHNVYQYKKGASWTTSLVGTGNGAMNDVTFGDGANSGTPALFAACGDGHVYQFTFQGGNWQKTDLGTVGVAVNAIALGDPMSANQYQVYALGGDSRVYQYSMGAFVPTPTPSVTRGPVPAAYFKLRDNQIDPTRNQQAVITWSQAQNGPVTITIYTMTGEKVAVLADRREFPAGQLHELRWDGKDASGRIVGSGIYIVHAVLPDRSERGKVAVVK